MNQRISLAAFRRSIFTVVFATSFFACSNDSNNNNHEKPFGNSLLLNFTSDYETGELRWMEIDSTRLSGGSLSLDQDSKVVTHNGNIFVLEKTYANLVCIDPKTMSVFAQRSLVTSSNPYDVAVVHNKGFIALHSVDYLQTFDVNTCALGEIIDLGIAGANASSISAHGDTLLVLLQRLEPVGSWLSATKPGLLLLISASSGNVINEIELNFYNPHASFVHDKKLFVASLNYGYLDGIEIVDLASGEVEILFDGGVSSMALDEDAQILYASVYVDWEDVPVKPINLNLSNKSVGANLLEITDAYNGLVFDSESKRLFVADGGGLKIYDTLSGQVTNVSNDLPPYSLAIARW